MKHFRWYWFVLLFVVLISCGKKGNTFIKLDGTEQNLPPELKGLKVYTIDDGLLSYIKVAVLNGQVNSATYPVGKTTQTTIIVNGKNGTRTIIASEILSETDNIIVIRK